MAYNKNARPNMLRYFLSLSGHSLESGDYRGITPTVSLELGSSTMAVSNLMSKLVTEGLMWRKMGTGGKSTSAAGLTEAGKAEASQLPAWEMLSPPEEEVIDDFQDQDPPKPSPKTPYRSPRTPIVEPKRLSPPPYEDKSPRARVLRTLWITGHSVQVVTQLVNLHGEELSEEEVELILDKLVSSGRATVLYEGLSQAGNPMKVWGPIRAVAAA
jgi:hypothetical protein